MLLSLKLTSFKTVTDLLSELENEKGLISNHNTLTGTKGV